MGDSTVYWRWSTLPNVHLDIEGGHSSLQPHNVDVTDGSEGSHFAREFDCSINEDHQEIVIRISRKPEAVHTVNVAMKIEGGLSEQPNTSVMFDGGVGNGDENGGRVSTFALTFKISQESVSKGVVEPEVEKIEECDHCIDYVKRGLHYHCTKCEAPCPKSDCGNRGPHSPQSVSKAVVEPEVERTGAESDECEDYIHGGHCTECEAPCPKCKSGNREPNSQQAWTNQPYRNLNSHQIRTDNGQAGNWNHVNSQQAWQQSDYGANSQQELTNQAYWNAYYHLSWANHWEAVYRNDVNSQQLRQQALQHEAETNLNNLFHQHIIDRVNLMK